MDWTKVKTAVATVAPWIAGSLGTPAAGMAVNALCQVLGLSPSLATPDNIQAAYAMATPDQLAALREAEYRHSEAMAQMGYNLDAAQISIDLADAKSGNWWQSGWRPYLAWWLVNAFVYHVIIYPVISGFFPLLKDVDTAGFAAVSGLLMTLIGARTFEKNQSIDTK